MKKDLRFKKKYYGILRYSYTTDKKVDVYTLKETYQECSCSEEGIKLYDTKQEAKDDLLKNELPDILVEFTSKIIK